MNDIFQRVKSASRHLAMLTDEERNTILNNVADAIAYNTDLLLEANAYDLSRMEKSNPLYDRLMLTTARLADIAADMRKVSTLPSPLGKVLMERTLDNGLHLQRISVPFGVIGMIYEARPNVTFDVFSLCFKTGNACILKGGKDADSSNRAAVALIKEVLRKKGIDENVVALLPATHESTAELLTAVGYVDLVIPRGGRRLIDFVRDNAKVPCIETGAGVVNTYFDLTGDISIAPAIINNAKTRRPSVCNSLDCLIVHSQRLSHLPQLVAPMDGRVDIYADERAYAALEGRYAATMLHHAEADSFGTEYMAMKLAVKTVDGLAEALDHISRYGSGHSECIITEDADNARIFQTAVDAACVYVNVPTSFTDGGQFGMGAEIGISTQKLGARGPMALQEITTYKWLISGHGQIRK